MKPCCLRLVIVVVALVGCEKSKDTAGAGSVCERYAELEVRCGGYQGAAATETLKVAHDYCVEARAGDKSDVMSALGGGRAQLNQ